MFWSKLDIWHEVLALRSGLLLPWRNLRVPEHQGTQFENHWPNLSGEEVPRDKQLVTKGQN